jgi:hypothetical protein
MGDEKKLKIVVAKKQRNQLFCHPVNGMHYQKRCQRVGKNVEADRCRIEMIRRGLTFRDLAAMVGRKPQQVANLLSGSNNTWPIRAQINRALRRRIFLKPKSARRRRKPAPGERIET